MHVKVICQETLSVSSALLRLFIEQKIQLKQLKIEDPATIILDIDVDHTQLAILLEEINQISGVIQAVNGGNSSPVNHLLSKYTFDNFVAVDPNTRQLVERAKRCALLAMPLLISGDTGTGKDMLAMACHNHSPRRFKPFLALNCAALPDEVVESELYGHAAGAYSDNTEEKKGFFEQANGGTVLLDEIGEMSPRMQTKLLRFLSEGSFRRVGEDQEIQVDIRVICATKFNLPNLVEQGLFRQDLYYRLNVLTLHLPSLSQRPLDILPLAQHFIHQFSAEQKITPAELDPELVKLLTQYSWPGNVRQLRNAIYQAMIAVESGNKLTSQHFPLEEITNVKSQPIEQLMLVGSLDEICQRFERSVLERLYQDYPSSRKLAKRLGVSHTTIANKLRYYSLTDK